MKGPFASVSFFYGFLCKTGKLVCFLILTRPFISINRGGGGGIFLDPLLQELRWVLEHFSVTPVLNGGNKCGGRFPGPLPSVLGSEWTLAQGLVDVLLHNGQYWSSLYHRFQLSSVSFPFSSNPWQQGRLLS